MPSYVLHLIIGIGDVDARIDLAQFGVELHIGSVYHVGDERQLVEIAVVDHLIVLSRQLHALLLGFELGIALQVEGVGSLYVVVYLLGSHLLALGGVA